MFWRNQEQQYYAIPWRLYLTEIEYYQKQFFSSPEMCIHSVYWIRLSLSGQFSFRKKVVEKKKLKKK